MAREIRPTSLEEVDTVSRYLTEHFHTPAEAEFAQPGVLRWKYFEPRDDRQVPRSLVAYENGVLVGHGGMCHGWFHRGGAPAWKVSVMHGIDWVSQPDRPSTGALLMMRGHSYSETQYALNYNESARRVIERAGYELVDKILVYQKVLRLGFRLAAPDSLPKAIAQMVRDAARASMHRAQRPPMGLRLRSVTAFGAEVEGILARAPDGLIFTSRQPAWLNHALRYPRSRLTGWLIEEGSDLRGFALLNLVARPALRMGRIVECFLDTDDARIWHAALASLVDELRAQNADVAECFASTPWMTEGLKRNGFYATHQVNFLLRDRQKLLPPGARFHLTPFVADYAYT